MEITLAKKSANFTPLVYYAQKWAGFAPLPNILTYKFMKIIKNIAKIYYSKTAQPLMFP